MIGRLCGTVVEQEADGTITLDVGGVGYELVAPSGTLGRAGLDLDSGRRVTLFVHTHVREDAIVLFGFASPEERAVFRLLVGISGIGPRTAVSILSSLGVSELAASVQGRDAPRLTRVPGVGKKTAERLLLELRDKLGAFALPAAVAREGQGGGVAVAGEAAARVVEALARLGYRPAEAERAVAALASSGEAGTPEQMLRAALRALQG
jgi:Holliday junction DNA helicase RuvA